MTLKVLKNAEVADANEVMANLNVTYRQNGYNTVRQLIDRTIQLGYKEDGEAFTSAAGRLGRVIQAETTASFNTNRYETEEVPSIYVVIEATSISSVSDFAINNCEIFNFASGKWVLTCTTGSDAVKRAQIIKTLFYGTNGTNPRASSTYITGLTALKTNISRDVGKRGYYVRSRSAKTNSDFGTYTAEVHLNGTFQNTSTNKNISSWSDIQRFEFGSEGSASWQLPQGTILHDAATVRIGTDRESDEKDNQANCRLRTQFSFSATGTGYIEVRVVLLSDGGITWVEDEISATSGTQNTTEVVDFNTDNSIPVFTEAPSYFSSVVTLEIPPGKFTPTISSLHVSNLIEISHWDALADIKFRLYNDTDDTGFLSFNDAREGGVLEFTQFTKEPTKAQLQLNGIVGIRGVYYVE